MSTTKYIAAGFLNDAEKLLKDFSAELSVSFSVFAEKWKAHKFAAIYLGRDQNELRQFTQEIFQITLGYLQKSSFIYQVGGIYLLYALYRNQLSESVVKEGDEKKDFVKIRLILPHWKIIKNMRNLAVTHKYMHLDYVICYLYQNAFDFVFHETLYGPRTSKGKVDVDKPTVQSAFLLNDVKTEVSRFHQNRIFENLKASYKMYAELKEKVCEEQGQNPGGPDPYSELDMFQKRLEGLLSEGSGNRGNKSMSATESAIGSRRAAIKAASFARKAAYRRLNISGDDDNEKKKDNPLPRRRKKGRRRKPKGERKIGRPRKKKEPEEKEETTDDVTCGEEDVKYPRRRGPIGKVSYLSEYQASTSAESSIKLQMVKKCTAVHSGTESTTSEEELNKSLYF